MYDVKHVHTGSIVTVVHYYFGAGMYVGIDADGQRTYISSADMCMYRRIY
jgi:hypothetical protein